MHIFHNSLYAEKREKTKTKINNILLVELKLFVFDYIAR